MNLAALRFHDFRIYMIGNIFALNGLWMQRLTIGWIAWELTGSASFVGLVAFIKGLVVCYISCSSEGWG